VGRTGEGHPCGEFSTGVASTDNVEKKTIVNSLFLAGESSGNCTVFLKRGLDAS
jgi:hypothetical protein